MNFYKLLTAILIFAFCASLQAETATVTFLVGKAEYRDSGTSPWNVLSLNSTVSATGEIKTFSDTELELTWNEFDNVSEIGSSENVQVSKLLKDYEETTSWDDKALKRLNKLVRKKSSNRIKAVAGIRRTEVEATGNKDFYWMEEEEVDFDAAYQDFLDGNLEKAAEQFEKLLHQNPISENAEFARVYAGVTYAKLKKSKEAKEHFTIFLRDFPESTFKSYVEEGLQSIK